MSMTIEEMWNTQIIKKAWEDPSFKQQLLENPKVALKKLFGIEVPDHINMTAVEETPQHFYLVIPPTPSDTIESDKVVRCSW